MRACSREIDEPDRSTPDEGERPRVIDCPISYVCPSVGPLRTRRIPRPATGSEGGGGGTRPTSRSEGTLLEAAAATETCAGLRKLLRFMATANTATIASAKPMIRSKYAALNLLPETEKGVSEEVTELPSDRATSTRKE